MPVTLCQVVLPHAMFKRLVANGHNSVHSPSLCCQLLMSLLWVTFYKHQRPLPSHHTCKLRHHSCASYPLIASFSPTWRMCEPHGPRWTCCSMAMPLPCASSTNATSRGAGHYAPPPAQQGAAMPLPLHHLPALPWPTPPFMGLAATSTRVSLAVPMTGPLGVISAMVVGCGSELAH